MSQSRSPRGKNLRPVLFQVFVASPDEPITLDYLAQTLHEPPHRIRTAISNLRGSGQLPGKLLPHGKDGNTVLGWIYRPNSRPAETDPEPVSRETEPRAENSTQGAIFEQVGTNKEGTPILRDEVGSLWRALPL